MRIELFEEYLVFAKHLNFSKAAAELNISQSALSKHISALEKDLRTQLVQRGEKIALTQSGVMLITYAQELVDIYRQARSEINKHARNIPVRLLWFESPRAKKVLQNAPSIPFVLLPFHDGKGASYFSAINENKADLVSLPLLHHLPELTEEANKHNISLIPAGHEQLSLVVSSRHPLFEQPSITLKDLDGCKVFMPDPAAFEEWRKVLAALFAPAQLSFSLRPISGNMDNMTYTDLEDLIFVYHASRNAQFFKDRADVKIFDHVDGKPLYIHQAVAYSNDNPNPNVSEFARYLASVLEESAQS